MFVLNRRSLSGSEPKGDLFEPCCVNSGSLGRTVSDAPVDFTNQKAQKTALPEMPKNGGNFPKYFRKFPTLSN